ncbi:hypothetical protein AB0K23_32555 [Streptomyces sp. NPDC049602]|uniref:hypothetical protein n=1 Tax=Streptomyces sp. NPDC049602 TaxID=3155504 RepID=UPI0034323097
MAEIGMGRERRNPSSQTAHPQPGALGLTEEFGLHAAADGVLVHPDNLRMRSNPGDRLRRTESAGMMEPWPEGPAADPVAARERYAPDTQAERKALREAIRADLPVAHLGLGIVIVASAVVGMFAGPITGALVAGSFAALFPVALVVMLLRGVRGLDAGRRACLFTFGWANWV